MNVLNIGFHAIRSFGYTILASWSVIHLTIVRMIKRSRLQTRRLADVDKHACFSISVLHKSGLPFMVDDTTMLDTGLHTLLVYSQQEVY
jgi:hypothetical protein